MERPYLHVAMIAEQTPKRAGNVCGDQIACRRTPEATTLIVCDGIGSGVRANLAARMTIARLTALLEAGFSLRDSFARTVETVERYKTRGTTYAAFSAASILPDGAATVLAYEAPEALIVGANGRTSPLKSRHEPLGAAVIDESACRLRVGDGLLLVSDGVTQAGLGLTRTEGWPMGQVGRFVEEHLALGGAVEDLPTAVHRQAVRYWGPAAGDDCTACLALLQRGSTLTILTGPPGDRADDGRVVGRFLAAAGEKVVCGGTTAAVVARESGRRLSLADEHDDPLTPPASRIDNVDLVTEGVVTLTHALNLLEVDLDELTLRTPAADLCRRLHGADRIRILLGAARNDAAGDLSLRRLGVFHREKVVRRLADALSAMDKLVTIERV